MYTVSDQQPNASFQIRSPDEDVCNVLLINDPQFVTPVTSTEGL